MDGVGRVRGSELCCFTARVFLCVLELGLDTYLLT
jgi:hypothetical protein